jgi:hypothetical protein
MKTQTTTTPTPILEPGETTLTPFDDLNAIGDPELRAQAVAALPNTALEAMLGVSLENPGNGTFTHFLLEKEVTRRLDALQHQEEEASERQQVKAIVDVFADWTLIVLSHAACDPEFFDGAETLIQSPFTNLIICAGTSGTFGETDT